MLIKLCLLALFLGQDTSQNRHYWTAMNSALADSNEHPDRPKYTKLQWDTRGGGDLHFQIEPLDEDRFKITHVLYDFGKSHQDLILEKTQNPKLFAFLKELLSGQSEIKSPSKTRGVTGTWNFLTLFDSQGHSKEVRITIFAKDRQSEILKELDQFVRSRTYK